MLNTYGRKMKGIKETASQTKNLKGYYSGEYVEVFYDKNKGTVWGKYQYSRGQNTYTVYNQKEIINIGNYSNPATMQRIADDIIIRLKEIEDLMQN